MGVWWAAHWTEVLGFVTGAGSVVLAQRRSMWNYPVGILNNLVFIVLFVPAALYADAGLQLVFLALAVAGWVGWFRARRAESTAHLERDEAFVLRTPRRAVPWLVASGIALAAVLTWLLTAFTDSTTQLADATTTAGSIVAQYMLNARWIENWFVWAAIDVGYVGLYAAKGLWITAALYLGFIGLCAAGWVSWRRTAAAHAGASAGTGTGAAADRMPGPGVAADA
ncbi:nicotinamide riboside transporter PnuC [Gryllotalpicola koreensis]|uniref:Nicotinamide riboside transporter PnuC n=1 Tax=Gryllotalpicola koreensis TaxID=993086 RepID=A0ABP7ZQS3_9MICO